MPKVTLPDGCTGLEFADGTKVDGRAGAAEVTERQAHDIDKSWYRRSGVMRGGQAFSFGTRQAAGAARAGARGIPGPSCARAAGQQPNYRPRGASKAGISATSAPSPTAPPRRASSWSRPGRVPPNGATPPGTPLP